MVDSSANRLRRQNWKRSNASSKGASRRFNIIVLSVAVVSLLIGCFYISLLQSVFRNEQSSSSGALQRFSAGAVERKAAAAAAAANPPKQYFDWRAIAVQLAKLPPVEALRELKEKDPFGTRTFANTLKPKETTLAQLKELWPCPAESHRISRPDQRNHTQSADFRHNTPGTFLYFQHLRKAGGTNFCTLAEANFPKPALPRYFCMPDYHWPHRKKPKQACAGCLHAWTNHEINAFMGSHRIAGNEWDSFDVEHHFDLPAVFVTSFRKPIDRALSQFRFECVEERGCKIKTVGAWWKKRRDLYNVYTWTFSDMGRQASFSTADTPDAAEKRGRAVGMALDTVAKFHLVLAMEWLVYAEGSVRSVLGFSDTTALTTSVRPHNQRKRTDSLVPEEYLSAEDYKSFSEQLVLDEILTDAAHRLFLERLVCGDDD